MPLYINVYYIQLIHSHTLEVENFFYLMTWRIRSYRQRLINSQLQIQARHPHFSLLQIVGGFLFGFPQSIDIKWILATNNQSLLTLLVV